MTNVSFKYKVPLWFQVAQIAVYASCIIVAAIHLGESACPPTQFGFGLDFWLLVAGISGLIYAVLPILLILIAVPCVCVLVCFLPILILLMVLKIPYFIVWWAMGIATVGVETAAVSACPVVFAFAIVAWVFFPIDLWVTYQHTKINDDE